MRWNSSYHCDRPCHVNHWQVPEESVKFERVPETPTCYILSLAWIPTGGKIQENPGSAGPSCHGSQEFPGRTLHQRDLLLGFRLAIRLSGSGMDHHALGRSCPNAWQQGAASWVADNDRKLRFASCLGCRESSSVIQLCDSFYSNYPDIMYCTLYMYMICMVNVV